MRQKRAGAAGEMTVFISITLLLIAAFLFTLVEGARFWCLRSLADMDYRLEGNSSLAEYDIGLLENYGLLFLDDSYGTGNENVNRISGRIMNLAEENLDPKTGFSTTLLRMQLKSCGVDSYQLATDDDGAPFIEQVVQFAKENVLLEAADIFMERMNSGKNAKTGAEQQNAAAAAGQMGNAAEVEEFENPREFADTLRLSSLLSTVKPEGAVISPKETDTTVLASERKLYAGNYEKAGKGGLDDRMWFLLYLKQNFGSFRKVMNNRALDYELEYILCGKDNDKDNLESVVRRLMLFRELMNLTYLVTDEEKTGIAEGIGTILAAAILVPEMAPIFKALILGAWAYIESLQDVKVLLKGGRIAIVKTKENWFTDPLHPVSSYKGEEEKPSEKDGFTYEEYLLLMLMTEGKKKLAFRTMDMIEASLRKLPGKQNFRMDCMIQRMDVSFSYRARPLFLSLVTIGSPDKSDYEFNHEIRLSYITEKP